LNFGGSKTVLMFLGRGDMFHDIEDKNRSFYEQMFKIIYLCKNSDRKIADMHTSSQQYRVVFPKHLNSNGTFFGGEAMQWLDEVAFITATRYSRQRMITVKIERIRFIKPILPDSIVEITGEIIKAGNVKKFIRVEVYSEDMYSQHREKAMEADFVFGSCNNDLSPAPLRKPNDQ
jgi:acyl-CoA hydrolase